MRFHKVVKVTYDREHDTFRYLFLILPCIVLAIVLHNAWTPFEVTQSDEVHDLTAIPVDSISIKQCAALSNVCSTW